MRDDLITLKSARDLERLVLAAFPDSRKQKASLSVFNGGVNINSYSAPRRSTVVAAGTFCGKPYLNAPALKAAFLEHAAIFDGRRRTP